MTTLSPTQKQAVELARSHDGKLVRLPGGFWTYPGCPVGSHPWGQVPAEYVGTNTVTALVRKGVFRESEHRTSRNLAGRSYLYPVAVVLEEDAK